MFEGKTVLITGGAQGIGSKIARMFKEEKASVIIQYLTSEEEALKLKEELNILPIKCDLTSEEDIKKLVSTSLNYYDKIDILINNAAIEINSDLKDKAKEDFMKTFDTNVVGPFLLSRLIADIMYQNKYGKIVNITSNNAIDQYDPNTLEYDASKTALISLTHNLSRYYAPYINVNAIAPGWILSDKVDKLNKELNNKLVEEESKRILKERFGTPEEVASLVKFLTSCESSYINDTIIRIDGGIKC